MLDSQHIARMNPSDKHRYTSPESGLETYQEVASLSKKLITEMLLRMIESAGDYHSWSLSDEDGASLVKLIQRKQRMICSAFSFQLTKIFSEFNSTDKAPAAGDHAGDSQKLGLVGVTSAGEVDALQSISSRYQQAFKEFDKTLLKRLQHCVMRSRAHRLDNPLQVKRLCESFQYSIDALDLDVSRKLALYQLFADRFIEALGPFYRKVDHLLLENGMVEELSAARIHLRNIDELSESRPPAGLRLNTSATLFSLLQQFKEKTRLASSEHKNLFVEVKQQFIRHGLVENTEQIDQLAMIFKLIFEDEELPEPIKQQISRLQIIIFITALQEDGFLKRSSNPARRLLDSIVTNEIKIAASENKDRSGIGFIRDHIDQLVGSDMVTLDSYAEMLEGYQKFLQQHNCDEQATQKSIAAKKMIPIVRKALDEVTRPLLDQDRPSILFDKLWMPLLLQIALQQGTDSGTWQKTMAMLKTQVWSLIPKTTEPELRELTNMLPHVSNSLHRIMRSLKLPQALQKSLRDCLKLEQQDVLKKTRQYLEASKHKTRSLAARSFESAIEETTEFSAMMETGIFQLPDEMLKALNAEKASVAKKAKSAEELARGDWVEIRQGYTTTLAKLTWKSDDATQFIFVDREGTRVCEVDAKTLASRLDSGEITSVSTGSVTSKKPKFSVIHSARRF